MTSGNKTVMVHPKHRNPYLAPNVTGFVIYSNELHPLLIPRDDRRFFVVANFDAKPRSPDYYTRLAALVDEHSDMIAEFCYRLRLDEDDLGALRGNAPMSEAKSAMSVRTWEQAYLDLVGELESDDPPPGVLPVATTSDLIKYFIREEIPPSELPHRLDFPSDLYRLGARPLNPLLNNPHKANPILGHRLWRIARHWRDQKGAKWDIERMGPKQLAQLYVDRAMPKPDFDVVKEDEL
jgi:hypothetical protein